MIRELDVEALQDRASDVPLLNLPIFTPADQAKYGVPKLMVNMVTPKDSRHPHAVALINMEKVFEGQRIGGTQLRVFKIEANGIGIEAEGTGSRYFLKF